MDPKEQAIQNGRDVQDMQKTPGWELIKARIKEEVQMHLDDVRRIELGSRSLESIGSDYVSNIQMINGLERVFEIIHEIEEEKEVAEAQS
jgi:hypothetical protein